MTTMAPSIYSKTSCRSCPESRFLNEQGHKCSDNFLFRCYYGCSRCNAPAHDFVDPNLMRKCCRLIEQLSYDLEKVFAIQGCALTALGRLRRLTFGFGRMRKITRSPGRALWLVVFLADKAAKNFNMLVVTVYETSQKMFFLRTKQLFKVSHVT